MALHGDESGRHAVHGDAVRRELASPRPHEADLCRLGGDVGRSAGARQVDDLRVDVDDATVFGRPHAGDHGASQQHRAQHEEAQLVEMVLPAHLHDRRLRLRSGGIQDQHLNRAQAVFDVCHEAVHLGCIGHIGDEGLRPAVPCTDSRSDTVGSLGVRAVDRDREAIRRQPFGNAAAESSGAAGHERDPRMVIHAASIASFRRHRGRSVMLRATHTERGCRA